MQLEESVSRDLREAIDQLSRHPVTVLHDLDFNPLSRNAQGKISSLGAITRLRKKRRVPNESEIHIPVG